MDDEPSRSEDVDVDIAGDAAAPARDSGSESGEDLLGDNMMA